MTKSVGPQVALLERAQAQGKPDIYRGKRDWTRYALGTRVTVTTDPTRRAASWDVNLHDISGGGVGFWSRRRLSVGAEIHVLDDADVSTPRWLPAYVTHCTIGLRGHLLGAAFHEPGIPDDQREWNSVAGNGDEPEGEEVTEERSTRKRQGGFSSLKLSLACATALASFISVLATAILSWRASAGLTPLQLAVTSCGTALMLGLVLGWGIARHPVRFLGSLQRSIRGMVVNASLTSQLREPRSGEEAAVHRAFLDLASWWRRHENAERVQRQRLEELAQIKSNILAIVSHDLRTPLTSILMYTQMLVEGLDTPGARRPADFSGRRVRGMRTSGAPA